MGTIDPEALLAHHDWVRTLARGLAGDASSAEDLEQETWARALASKPHGRSDLKAWLGAITRNVAREGWRRDDRAAHVRRRVVAEHGSEAALGAGRSAERAPDEHQVRMETHKALLAALVELEEPYGSTVYLHFVEELSVRVIATRLAVPEPTIRTRLRRGLELLRERVRGSLGTDWRARVLVLAAPGAKSLSLAAGVVLSTKLKLALAAGLVAVLLPLGLHLALASEDEAAPEGATATSTVAHPTRMADELVLPGAVVERAEDRTEAGAAAVEAEHLVIPPAGTESGAGGVRVTVRDAVTLEPISGVEILSFDRGSALARDFDDAMFREGLDVEQLLERFGERSGTDAHGVAFLPERASYLHLAARTVDAYTADYLMDEPLPGVLEEVELILLPRAHVDVRVLDHRGDPVAGQTVQIQELFTPLFGQALAEALTDDFGRATFRNIQKRLLEADRRRILRIEAPLPGRISLGTRLDPDAPPEGEVLLRLPADGRVRVHVRDEQGFAARDGIRVFVQAVPDEHIELMIGSSNAALGAAHAFTRDGQVELRVQLGQELMAWTLDPRTQEVIHAVFVGPQSPGASVEVLLEISGKVAEKLVFVVDEAGKAVRSNLLEVEHVSRTAGLVGPPARVRSATGEDGLLRAYAPPARDATEQALYVETGSTFIAEEQKGRLRFGWTDWIEDGTATLVLGEDLLVAGVVQNEKGEPVPGALLGLTFSLPWNAERENAETYLTVKADARGRFSLRGPILEQPDSYQLQFYQPVSETSFAPTDVTFAVGESSLVVENRALATVSGRIIVDAGVPDLLSLRLEILEEDDARTELLRLDSLGRFEHKVASECRAVLTLVDSAGQEIARSPELTLRLGVSVTPRGWDALDLRGKVWKHELDLRARSGSVPQVVRVEFPDLSRTIISRLPVQIISASEWVTVSVEAEGYAKTAPERVSGLTVIRLQELHPGSGGR